MNRLIAFCLFFILIGVFLILPSMNSTLLGIDMTVQPDNIKEMMQLGIFGLAISILIFGVILGRDL